MLNKSLEPVLFSTISQNINKQTYFFYKYGFPCNILNLAFGLLCYIIDMVSDLCFPLDIDSLVLFILVNWTNGYVSTGAMQEFSSLFAPGWIQLVNIYSDGNKLILKFYIPL